MHERTRWGIVLVALAICGLVPSAATAQLRLGVHQGADAVPDAQEARAARALDSTGAAAIRAQIDWSDVQPTQGLQVADWHWSEANRWFRALARSGTGSTPTTDGVGPDFVTLIGTPNWAKASICKPGNRCVPGQNFRDEWETFVKQAVRRYGIGGTFWADEGLTGFAVRNWGVWNEPNANDNWNGEANPNQYRDLLAQTYRAIREVDPAHQIVGVNLAYRDGPEPPSWMRELMRDTNAGDFMDKIGVHFYLATPDKVVPAAREVKNLPGPDNIAITEMGWSIGNEGEGRKCVATPEKQAENLRAAIRDVRDDAPVVSWLFWFNGIDKDTSSGCSGGTPDGARFGLFRDLTHSTPDGGLVPKCAFYAYRALATDLTPTCPLP